MSFDQDRKYVVSMHNPKTGVRREYTIRSATNVAPMDVVESAAWMEWDEIESFDGCENWEFSFNGHHYRISVAYEPVICVNHVNPGTRTTQEPV